MEETPTSQVDEQKFAQVLGILRQERQNYLLTHKEKLYFTLLKFFVYGFSLSFFPFIYFLAIRGLMRPYWGTEWENWAESIYTFLLTPMAGLLGISSLVTLILLLLNLPLVNKIMQQNLRMRRLNFTDALRKERQLRFRRNNFLNILLLLGGGAVCYGVVHHYLAGQKAQTEEVVRLVKPDLALPPQLNELIKNLFGPAENRVPFIILVLVFGIFGFFIITIYFLNLGSERLAKLAELANLEDSLQSSQLRAQQVEAPDIEVPAEDLERVARIEQSQIARERAEAIVSYRQSASSEALEYALLKSRNIITEIGELNLELRLRVEEQIERLSSDPHPKESFKDSSDDYWRLRIPETFLELTYTVDDSQRQIQLMALQALTDRAGLDPAPGNGDHA